MTKHVVGFSLDARLLINGGGPDGVPRGCLKASGRGDNLRACPTSADSAWRTAFSLSMWTCVHASSDLTNLHAVKKGLVKRPEDGRWSSYNNFALDQATVAACPLQIDDVRLPLGYRAW